MTTTVTIPQSAVYTALGNFIVSTLGLDAAHVVQGYPNRVAMPVGPFVNMTAISMKRLRTNIDTIPDDVDFPSEVSAEQGTQIDVQIDCYGPASGDWATILTTLLRDNVGCLALAPTCQPLYADDPIRSPLVTAEEQYEDRWIVLARIQFNPTVVTSQQYSDSLGPVGIIDVEVSYPP